MIIRVALTRTVGVDSTPEGVAFDMVREHFARRTAELLHLRIGEDVDHGDDSHIMTIRLSGAEETMLEFLRRMREAKVVGFDCYTSDEREAGLLASIDPLPVVEVERFDTSGT